MLFLGVKFKGDVQFLEGNKGFPRLFFEYNLPTSLLVLSVAQKVVNFGLLCYTKLYIPLCTTVITVVWG